MVQKQQSCEESKNEYASELQKTNECQRQHFSTLMPLIFEVIVIIIYFFYYYYYLGKQFDFYMKKEFVKSNL